ncbi:hypothetical protein [[Clostridium] polysaccharolyticum]|uniref:Uncharacterized protein n=1 Tax=[Clostridium] polysaccharolyticum TaxID=29364 RepID=A0A1H9Z9C2_9FIRM|nr:hypothetical protein [[Clostridium] polysaccharolyticum]SES78203.1 hypothetical protein SAMN04487772_10375 [[Clostridium] polysaccharolyticum]
MSNLSVEEMAKILGDAWAQNRGDDFIALFSENAVINHPFFVNDEDPRTIVEVLNCNVKGTSEYKGYKLIDGDGTGENDVIEMSFYDTGNNCGYTPKYQGDMVITAYIKNHEFVRFDVFGYKIVETENQGKKFKKIEDIQVENAYDLAKLAGKAWEENDMDMFTSLFTEDAKIFHPLFKKPVTPDIVSDVLNSPMEGVSRLSNVNIISGDGSGEEDIIDMYFDETGVQLGYLPKHMGVLHMTAKIKDRRFTEFVVHSYTPVENKFDDNLKVKAVETVSAQKMSVKTAEKDQ